VDESDFVFASEVGTPLDHRNTVRRMLDPAAKKVKLSGGDGPNLRFHDLRHCFTSLLIAQGATIVFVSRQLGHASPNITLAVYAHLFDAAQHAKQATAALEASFGGLLDGNAAETSGRDEAKSDARPAGANVVPMPDRAVAGS
jgi:integrase